MSTMLANMADTSEPQYFNVEKVLDLRQVHTGGRGPATHASLMQVARRKLGQIIMDLRSQHRAPHGPATQAARS